MTTTPRAALAARRRTMGLSQEDLAAHLGVDRYTVSRWERGITQPQPYVRSRLAAALDWSPATLDRIITPVAPGTVAATRQPATGGDEMLRRDVLRLATLTAASLATPSDTTAPDPRDVTGLEAVAGHLWRVYATAPAKAAVYPGVVDYLNTLHTSLSRSLAATTMHRLTWLTANGYQLAGEILYDTGRFADAATCYALAASAARDGGHPDMWACAMVRHGLLHLGGDDAATAGPLLDAADRIAAGGDPQLPTRAWIAAVTAEAAAATGDSVGCLRALDTAENSVTEHQPGGWLRFDGARLPEQRGTCLLNLGDDNGAAEALEAAARSALTPRRHASVTADRATVALHRGDPDQLAEHVDDLIDTATRHDSGYIWSKVERLHRRIRDNGDPRYSTITDQLTAIRSETTA